MSFFTNLKENKNLTNCLMNNDLSRLPSIDAPPKAGAMINTFRAYGYNLQTAIADIIDNSISANAKTVWINYTWDGQDSFVTILDDGKGMDDPTLIDAMTPGSKNPDDPRSEQDLGRFGLGLKTASFSQCKALTVAAKRSNEKIHKKCWDLDFVNKSEKWLLLDYISRKELLDDLNNLASGTLVVWEKLDRLTGNAHKVNEAVMDVFLEEFEKTEKHLGMVFHRFIEKKKLKIWINGQLIQPWDPFLKKQSGYLAAFEKLANKQVQVRCYVLPHISSLNEDERRDGAGPNGWYDQQGFYIYRNERLLVAGNWLGLFTKNEHSKLARICVDFSNQLDHEWKLDIKKSSATPPPKFRKDFDRLGKLTRLQSAKVYKHRGTQLGRNPDLPDFNFEPIWKPIERRDQTIDYEINQDHPLVNLLLAQNQTSKKDLKRLLAVIEKNIPIETILFYQSENPSLHELREPYRELDEPTKLMAKRMFDALMIAGTNRDIAIKQILKIEPFNHFPELNEYL